MCGRYAFGIRAAFVRYQLQQDGLDVDDWPDDSQVRETYNFAPGYYGLVYRADVPEYGAGGRTPHHDRNSGDDGNDVVEPEDHAQQQQQPQDQDQYQENDNNNDHDPKSNGPITTSTSHQDPSPSFPSSSQPQPSSKQRYILQPMKWGLIPFWTKRSPDYASLMRTINCRDDSLVENRGMWTTMKMRKRCIVMCQGFYEWLKKGPGGKEKIPHFIKRKDGLLMCFAGLWDCVKYDTDGDGEGERDKLWTYTVITTDSNKQLKFLHDRMPVILDQGSEAMRTWLDPGRTTWSKELQSLLRPYEGELEAYPVSKEVGKVGNNSPDFLVPVDSVENKKNIRNFFANAEGKKEKKVELAKGGEKEIKEDKRETKDVDEKRTEDNAPMPVPVYEECDNKQAGVKRPHSPDTGVSDDKLSAKIAKTSPEKEKVKEEPSSSPEKLKAVTKPLVAAAKKTRSATSNETKTKKGSPTKKNAADGSQKITNFFVK